MRAAGAGDLIAVDREIAILKSQDARGRPGGAGVADLAYAVVADRTGRVVDLNAVLRSPQRGADTRDRVVMNVDIGISGCDAGLLEVHDRGIPDLDRIERCRF